MILGKLVKTHKIPVNKTVSVKSPNEGRPGATPL